MTANSGETLKQARFSGSAMRRREAWPELLFANAFLIAAEGGCAPKL